MTPSACRGLYHTRSDLRGLPLDALARIALPLHDPKRVPHVLGCSHTAAELAARFGRIPTRPGVPVCCTM